MQPKVSFPLYRVGSSQTSLNLFIYPSIKTEEAKFEGKLQICWSSEKGYSICIALLYSHLGDVMVTLHMITMMITMVILHMIHK